MNKFRVISGKFTAAGNFTGYTAKGERIHIYGRQMESVGMKADADVKLPLFVIGETKQINPFDENGEPKMNADGTPELTDRLTALSVFKSKEDLVEVYVEEATLDMDIQKSIRERATSAGLTEEQVNQLANQSW